MSFFLKFERYILHDLEKFLRTKRTEEKDSSFNLQKTQF